MTDIIQLDGPPRAWFMAEDNRYTYRQVVFLGERDKAGDTALRVAGFLAGLASAVADEAARRGRADGLILWRKRPTWGEQPTLSEPLDALHMRLATIPELSEAGWTELRTGHGFTDTFKRRDFPVPTED